DLCMRGWKLDKVALEEMRETLKQRALALSQSLAISTRGLVPTSLIEYIQRKGSVKLFPLPAYGKAGNAYVPIEIPPGTKMLKTLPFPVFQKKVTPIEFNPNSSPQVQTLITNMGIKVPLAKGKPTADEAAILKILDKKDLPSAYRTILENI